MTKDLSWLRTLPGRPLIVAEIKRRSPYGWVNPLVTYEQLAICESVGDIISVHTDELWGGSMEHLASVRASTSKPILAKGFHPTIAHVKAALAAGADHVLTVGWWPGDYPHLAELGKHCWFEAETTEQMRDTKAPRVVWNQRNPRTGQTYTAYDPRHQDRKTGWLCLASCISRPEDVWPGMDAILIGEGLYA